MKPATSGSREGASDCLHLKQGYASGAQGPGALGLSLSLVGAGAVALADCIAMPAM